ncbi:MAG: hypothetical protein FD121_1205 [Gallionellaceae bacterium]|nr:MAG: hypothetical protein FD121_1205 [Gallionellaceae bacterium]
MVKTMGIYLSGVIALLAIGMAQAAPYFVAAGTARNGTGAVTVSWPAHVTDDVALLFVESAGGQPVTLSTPSGFVQVTNSPQATGAGTAGTQLSVYWARATSAAMPSVVVADPGDHVYARIITYRGVINSGNPWDVTGGGVKAVAGTTVTVAGVTTTAADTLIVQAVARSNDSSAAAFSAETNASLVGIGERSDGGTTSGNGGGFAVWDGSLMLAGASGNTTATVTSSINAFFTIALKPAPGTGSVTASPSSCVNVAGIGTLPWATTANAISSNNAFSTISLNDGQVSNYLRCTGYGFAIPAGATITGIVVNVERKASSTNSIRDAAMRLVKEVAGAPVIQTPDRSTLTNYTTADVVEAHGGAADLWGGAWTPADINSTNFGAAVASQKPGTAGGARTVSVDHMSVTVRYTTSLLHHVSISAPTNEMSLTEVPVVITPHTISHGAITAVGTLSLSTSTGTGDWVIGTGTGILTPGAANSGLASYTFGAAESSVTLGFISQAGGTVTLNVADSGGADMLLNTPLAEKANTITFTPAAFAFTNSACTHNVAFGTPGQCALVTWTPRTAGLSLSGIYITSVNTAGVPTRLHPTQVRTRNMQFGASCHNPVANAGVRATFSATAALLPLCQSNGATPTTWTAGVDLSFAGGSTSVGPYSFNYDDVGQVEIQMRNSAATMETGGSGAFVVKPADFVLSAIKRSSDNFPNPAAANAGGTAFVKAGEAFSVTVMAVNAGGTATPNYGKETSAESVKLNPALVTGLGLTNNPAVAGGFGVFAGGVATGAAFEWDEVGIITLTPSVGDGSYLGAGDVTGTTSGNVGRFSLGKFALQNITFDERADLCQNGFLVADGVTPCASTFTYMGERIDANFTLAPASLNGALVHNYVDSATVANDFAKLDPSTFANLNIAAVDRATVGGPYFLTARVSNSGMPAATCATVLCFEAGSAIVTVPFTFSRNVAPDGAYAAVGIGIAPVDSDGARVEGVGAVPGLCNNPNAVDCYDLDSDALIGNDRALLGTGEFRHGRTRIANSHGSELLALTLPVAMEYWNGATFTASADDSLSVVAVALGNYQRNLNAGETILSMSAIIGGLGRIGLSAPGAGNNGSVDVTVTSPGYLPGNTGRATFGVYKGSTEFIYLHEAY